jgi:selenide,water dikinase
MGPGDLAQVLRPLQEMFHSADFPELLVGLGRADDAAVYRLSDERALILTVDFFPPVVDDPYTYGAVAAANAMSDIYAMGGEVLFALNVAAFPKWLGKDVIGAILRGGAEKVREAGGAIAGGHTIDDEEPKYGLCVAGMAHPARILTKGGAQVGDRLVLTKALGTGLITTVLKAGAAEASYVEAAVASMTRLNRAAAHAAQEAGVHAATDITGFSLLGHGLEMATLSGVGLLLRLRDIPLLPGAHHYADEWLFPAGSNRNQDYFGHAVTFDADVSAEEQLMLFTPETSGGLLLAVAPERLDALLTACRRRDQPAWVIGEVVAGAGIRVLA